MGDPNPATTTLATIKSSSPSTTTPPPPEIDLSNPPFPLSAVDRALLATPDAHFPRITWTDLRHIIAANDLAQLKRTPDDSKRYLTWSDAVKRRYGDITAFILQERLGWAVLPEDEPGSGPPRFAFQSPVPFERAGDFATLRNDWPYGFTPEITHLVVWSKTPIAVETADGKGDVTADSRRTIVDFVERFFVRDLEARGLVDEGRGWERVQWFKNWVGLQSVRGVDHVHVLVRDVPREVVEEWCTRRN